MINPTDVANAAKQGLARAQLTYKTWSGCWKPPELVVTVSVAAQFARLRSIGRLSLEGNIQSTLERAGGRRRQHSQKLPAEGRFDIVVWNRRGRPEGVVEIKSFWNAELSTDVERVCGAIESGRTIRWGLVAYICALDDDKKKDVRKRVRDRTKKVFADAQDAAQDDFAVKRHRGQVRVEDCGAWAPEVLELHEV